MIRDSVNVRSSSAAHSFQRLLQRRLERIGAICHHRADGFLRRGRWYPRLSSAEIKSSRNPSPAAAGDVASASAIDAGSLSRSSSRSARPSSCRCRNPRQPRDVLRPDGPHQSGGSMPDSTASASFGPTPLTANQPLEQLQLERRPEAVERQSVLAHVRVNAQRSRHSPARPDCRTSRAGSAHRTRRRSHRRSRAIGMLFQEATSDPRDHGWGR